RCFAQLTQPVSYAYSGGVIPRDLKPGNIMVGACGEVQVMEGGLPRVRGKPAATAASPAEELSTIHTVRTTGTDPSTESGAVMGTPGYMAPEQARGEVEKLDERCDVFGLGAILCLILTGRPPYTASGSANLVRQASQGDLADTYLRLDNCGADAELRTLAKACLAPDPEKRPRHAGQVAEQVAAYQAQVQERLRQAELECTRAVVKAQEERKRRRLALVLAAAVVMLLAGGSAVGFWYQHQEAEQERRLGEAEKGIE